MDEMDALRAMEARLDQAAAAAERLIGEAASQVPRNGWQRPGEGEGERGADRFAGWLDPADGELLLGLLGSLRERIPDDLQRRLVAALHELVLALRALIDWCVARAERRRAAPADDARVQDIPIL